MAVYQKPRFLLGGDKTLYVELGDEISPEINQKVRAVSNAIDKAHIHGLIDLLPTYRSIQVYYDPLKIPLNKLKEQLTTLSQEASEETKRIGKVVEIPVAYGGEFGPDLGFVASHNNLTADAVIEIHCSIDYLVHMLGFNTGFPYLGGLPEKIATPRLNTPRVRVPAGSVGIAESQTGIYPLESPGGWQLIGRSPIRLFDPIRESPVLTEPGDYIRFVPIDESKYREIEKRVASGSYQVTTTEVS